MLRRDGGESRVRGKLRVRLVLGVLSSRDADYVVPPGGGFSRLGGQETEVESH
jgi:hypothetical protein